MCHTGAFTTNFSAVDVKGVSCRCLELTLGFVSKYRRKG